MDPYTAMGMVFSLIVLAMIGGFILMYPITRRLGQLMESRLIHEGDGVAHEQIKALTEAVESLREEVEHLGQRQDFTERLLERPKDDA